jgi:hypothetical protein
VQIREASGDALIAAPEPRARRQERPADALEHDPGRPSC